MAKSKGRLLSELAEAPKNEDYSDVNALPNTGNKVGDQAFVEETDRLYIWNGSGWYNIALINTTPTWDSGGQPAGSYVLDADSPQTSTTITLAASDPEGIPINYTYVTSGQMDSIATISQDSSVFTITPKTEAQAPDGGTGNITFRASDGVNILPQVSSFTLNFITDIENSRYTTLLATATGTSDNNNITDASPNNYTITVNGDTHAGTFSPFKWNGYSQYYDGSSYQIYNNWSDITGLSNVTIECWIYKTSHTGSYHSIMSTRANPSNTQGFDMRFSGNSGILTVYYTGGGGVTSTTNMNLNTWYHVMFVRDGSTGTLYIDGVQEDQDTSWTDRPGLSNLYVGTYARGNTLLSGCLNAYISDLRISNISRTAEVPEAPISVDSNTLFHIAGKHGPYDTSSSYYSPSFTGLSSANLINLYGPYNAPITGYSATDHGGSIYFDDTFDCLQLPGNINLGGDFTVSAWIYMQGTSKAVILGSTYPPNYQFFIDNSNVIGFHDNTTTVNGTGVVQRDMWNYCVWTRSGSTVSMYVDGESRGTGTSSATFQIRYVGSLGNLHDFFNGYISDLQIKTTSTSAANAVPPTAPLSSSGTSLHIKGTDASIIDKSQGSNLKLFGNTTGSTTQVKFGGSKSMYFDGTGDYISISADDSIFSKDYTIEFWMYPTQDTNLLMPFSKGVGLQFYHQSGNIGAAMSSSNSGTYFYNGNFGSITTNAWSHISLVRDSSASTYKFYINGTLEDTLSSSTNIDAGSADWIIAAYSSAGSYAFEGYIQDVRVTEGLTRYTANFTPPSAPLEG